MYPGYFYIVLMSIMWLRSKALPKCRLSSTTQMSHYAVDPLRLNCHGSYYDSRLLYPTCNFFQPISSVGEILLERLKMLLYTVRRHLKDGLTDTKHSCVTFQLLPLQGSM